MSAIKICAKCHKDIRTKPKGTCYDEAFYCDCEEKAVDLAAMVAAAASAKISTRGSNPIRVDILNEASRLTSGDRDKTYGDPHVNLTCYADLCSAYLNFTPTGKDWQLDAVDASILMVLAKISRIAVNKNHRDNYVDGAAYMAIAGECAERDS